MAHQKHTKLQKPSLGNFHRNEIAIMGTTCGKISSLVAQIATIFQDRLRLSYIDADHKAPEQKTRLDVGFSSSLVDKISFKQINYKSDLNEFDYRRLLVDQDLVLVNGNHFKASRQIIVLDPKKKDSIKRKLDRIDDVFLFLSYENSTDIYDFLKDHLPDWKNIPLLSISEHEKIVEMIETSYNDNLPKIFGLVLTGGKSSRMGEDKGKISYFEQEQYEHVADLIQPYCAETFISARKEQMGSIKTKHTKLEDKLLGLGPFGAIASAFQYNPNVAWLVVANDIPLISESTIKNLVFKRNTSKIATAYKNPESKFPEPLITIWEPRAYARLFDFLTQGYSCPRKVLINSPVELLEIEDADELINANTPQEKKRILSKLKSVN